MAKIAYSVKTEAQYLVQKYPSRVIVEFECEHDDERKQRHHYDYTKPYNVHLLCSKCHGETRKKWKEGVEFKIVSIAIPIKVWKKLRKMVETGKIESISDGVLRGLRTLILNMNSKE